MFENFDFGSHIPLCWIRWSLIHRAHFGLWFSKLIMNFNYAIYVRFSSPTDTEVLFYSWIQFLSAFLRLNGHTLVFVYRQMSSRARANFDRIAANTLQLAFEKRFNCVRMLLFCSKTRKTAVWKALFCNRFILISNIKLMVNRVFCWAYGWQQLNNSWNFAMLCNLYFCSVG